MIDYFRLYFFSHTLHRNNCCLQLDDQRYLYEGNEPAQFGSGDQSVCRVHYLKLRRSGRVKVIRASSRCRNSIIEMTLVCVLHFKRDNEEMLKKERERERKERESINNISVNRVNKEKIIGAKLK